LKPMPWPLILAILSCAPTTTGDPPAGIRLFWHGFGPSPSAESRLLLSWRTTRDEADSRLGGVLACVEVSTGLVECKPGMWLADFGEDWGLGTTLAFCNGQFCGFRTIVPERRRHFVETAAMARLGAGTASAQGIEWEAGEVVIKLRPREPYEKHGELSGWFRPLQVDPDASNAPF
jgi:hypothetical protein